MRGNIFFYDGLDFRLGFLWLLFGVLGMGFWYGRWTWAYLMVGWNYGFVQACTGIRHTGMGMCIDTVIRLFLGSGEVHRDTGTHVGFGHRHRHVGQGCV
jgi:hypothetical protein